MIAVPTGIYLIKNVNFVFCLISKTDICYTVKSIKIISDLTALHVSMNMKTIGIFSSTW